MKETGVIRSVVVVTLLLVGAELFLQGRNYAWLTDFFGDSGVPQSGRPPYDPPVIRGVWIVATAMLVVTATLVGSRRWIPALALLAFGASIWLTPSTMILPWQDPDVHLSIGQPDTAYQAALGLIAFAAAALGALLLLPRKPA